MNKVATNARWIGLPAEHLETLENWLFNEKLTYPVALERAQRELGYKGSLSGLKRFYRRRSKERTVMEFKDAYHGAENVVAAPGNTRLLRTAAMKMVSHLFFKRVMEKPDAVKEWESLAKLILQSEDNELRWLAKDEENAIRRENLAFSKEQYQFNIVDQMMGLLPDVNALAKMKQDPQVSEFEHNKLINKLEARMFGEGVFDPLPESEKEQYEHGDHEAMLQRARRKAHEHRERTGEWINPDVFVKQELKRLGEIRYPLPDCPHTNSFEI